MLLFVTDISFVDLLFRTPFEVAYFRNRRLMLRSRTGCRRDLVVGDLGEPSVDHDEVELTSSRERVDFVNGGGVVSVGLSLFVGECVVVDDDGGFLKRRLTFVLKSWI